jgi:hypothetical protein
MSLCSGTLQIIKELKKRRERERGKGERETKDGNLIHVFRRLCFDANDAMFREDECACFRDVDGRLSLIPSENPHLQRRMRFKKAE